MFIRACQKWKMLPPFDQQCTLNIEHDIDRHLVSPLREEAMRAQNSIQWRHNEPGGVSNQQPYDQSSDSLAFVRGIHRGPVNSPHKWPVTRKMFPFDDVIMPQVFEHSRFIQENVCCCDSCRRNDKQNSDSVIYIWDLHLIVKPWNIYHKDFDFH